MPEYVLDDPSTQNFVRRGIERLRDEFRGIFSHETIQCFVDESIAALAGARIKEFVPLFVNRFARERLQALAQVQGAISKDVPEVLFVCVHNAGRSVMAEAFLAAQFDVLLDVEFDLRLAPVGMSLGFITMTAARPEGGPS